MKNAADQLDITLAVLTRGRPRMLRNCLQSLCDTSRPKNTNSHILVVENGASEGLEFPTRNPTCSLTDSISHIREDKIGIPFGRNAAAKWAIAEGSDLLVFVDDDETVATDWLEKLVESYRQSDAVLLGGPVRIAPPAAGLNWLERKMHDGVVKRFAIREKFASDRATLNSTDNVTIATNNWLADIKIFTEHGIWFDESMVFTGGSDSTFYRQVVDKGLTTGWVKDAIVYEEIPRDRLSVGYQFRRARDQSNTSFTHKIENSKWARFSVLLSIPSKILSIILLAILLLFTKWATLHDLCRTSGWVIGRIAASLGIKSNHYAQVTGS